MLTDETSAILARRPDLKLVKVADGAADNWAYLSSDALPPGEEAVGFFHGGEHLHAATMRVDQVPGSSSESRGTQRAPTLRRAGSAETARKGFSTVSKNFLRPPLAISVRLLPAPPPMTSSAHFGPREHSLRPGVNTRFGLHERREADLVSGPR